MTLVIDAGPLVTFADLRDSRYETVQRIMLTEPGPLVIPAPITTAAEYLIGRRAGGRARLGFLDDLAAGRFEVDCLSVADYAQIATLERQYADLGLGLADLAIVVIAARRRCSRLFTFDERRFRAVRPLYGDAFTLLPADE